VKEVVTTVPSCRIKSASSWAECSNKLCGASSSLLRTLGATLLKVRGTLCVFECSWRALKSSEHWTTDEADVLNNA